MAVRGFLVCSLIALALTARAAAAASEAGPTDPREVSEFVDRFVAAADNGRPLASAAFVLVRESSVLVAKGYGHADSARTVPVDPDTTVFRAASISKAFAATAVMQLVEEGKIDLNADVNSYLTRFKIESKFDRPVTAHDLLTHTAGFEDRFMGDLAAPGHQVPLGDYFAARTPRRSMPPGAEISYSNHGMALAGYLVEAVSGISFDRYAEEHLFVPLGMQHTSYRQPPPSGWRLAAFRFGGKQPPDIVFNPYPAATLVCTPSDMGRFLLAHLNGGAVDAGRILRADTVEEMHRQHWTASPEMPGVAYGLFESFGNGRRALFHTGDSGHHSIIYLMPAEKVGFFFVYAGSDESVEVRERFVQAFLDHYYPAPRPFALPEPPPDFAGRAGQFAGVYVKNQFSRSNFEKIKTLMNQIRLADGRDGTLWLHPPGGAHVVKLVEIGRGRFRTDEGGYIAFRRRSDGRVEGLTVTGSVWDPGGWDRAAWYETAGVSFGLAGLAFAILAMRAVAWPIVGLVRRSKKLPRLDLGRPSARLAWRPVGSGKLAGATRSDRWDRGGSRHTAPPVTSVPIALVVGLALLLVSVIAGLLTIPLAIASWRAGTWPALRRIQVAAVCGAALILGVVLCQYNLLGFWF